MGDVFLEDGSYFKGKSFGFNGIKVGEIVFNTSMCGYQSMLTDPSYAGQIITMTYPLVGNYGISNIDNESFDIHAFGLIVKEECDNPSNANSLKNLGNWLKEKKIIGISNVDTRKLTKIIRTRGTMKAVISSNDITKEKALSLLKNTKLRDDYMKTAGIKKYTFLEANKKNAHNIAIIDFGIKNNILNYLRNLPANLHIYPYGVSPEKLLGKKVDGVFLPNGPADPRQAKEAIATVKKIVGKVPIFGICMGHQILSLALGLDIYKMKFGHRGGNHGVKNLINGRSYITSQNHSFAVDAKSVNNDIDITHINLNDNSVEGIRSLKHKCFSVQFHPEGAPGPADTENFSGDGQGFGDDGLFNEFVKMMSDKNE